MARAVTPNIIVTVDVAHGHHDKVAATIKQLRNEGFEKIIAGNVATYDGYVYLMDAGANAIKVGIGPGSVCTTREVTGVGVPQLSAIMDCVEAQQAWAGPPIIADGGIKNSGDIVKALAAGADMVMLGSLLAGTAEAPGETVIDSQGTRWRPYRGQSIFGVNESKYTPEGIEGWVKERGPVADVLKHLAGGIRSGLSYVGANNLDELRMKANFVQVSHSTHIESKTRIPTEVI
jgi:IMP dehydrogenase